MHARDRIFREVVAPDEGFVFGDDRRSIGR
jgi:hypothetical protein